jgi:hypothetical protein
VVFPEVADPDHAHSDALMFQSLTLSVVGFMKVQDRPVLKVRVPEWTRVIQ